MAVPFPAPNLFRPPMQAQVPGQPSIMDRLRNNSDTLLMMGLGGLSGQTGSQQAAGMAQGFFDARKTARQRQGQNQTIAWLRTVDPSLAAAAENGTLPIAEAFKLGYDQRLKAQTAGSKTDQYGFPVSGTMSQKMRAYEMQGIDRDTALALASGRKSISINPQTGERVIVDMATNEILPLKQPDYGDPATANPAGIETDQGTTDSPGLYDMADEATGVGSSLATGISNTVGQIPGAIGDMATFPDQVRAGQEFELFKRDLVRSLSLNPRFPVAEQQRIENLVPRGAFTAPDTLKQSLRALDRELARIEQEAAAGANDPRAPIEQRQADTATLRSVQAARERLGVPQGVQPTQAAPGAGASGSGGWTTLPNGTRIREKSDGNL